MLRQTALMEPGRIRLEHGSVDPNKERRVFALLICGFALITLLLGLDAWVGYHGTASVRSSVAVLTENQLVSVPLIDELQQVQSVLSSIQFRLPAADPGENVRLKREIGSVEKSLDAIFLRIPATDPELETWREIQIDFSSATAEIDRILAQPVTFQPDLSHLTSDRERLSSATAKLVQSSLARAEANRRQIEQATREQSLDDRLLLIACLFVASLFLWTAVRIYYRMNEQAKELSHVSWQLLEKQESLARRLSRDLHDELGQTLTALKTNFSRHNALPCVDPAWMQDCVELLKQSIQSAHEISQLLRPTLLDDFGLDSALAWLCERFEERHQIQASYVSDIRGRLEEHTETHLFRIAQEALTNIARHAGASWVQVTFARERNGARLEISDNGIGLPPGELAHHDSFGLTGMKARARSLQGEMHIRSAPGRGTVIEVTFPLQELIHEETDSHLVG